MSDTRHFQRDHYLQWRGAVEGMDAMIPVMAKELDRLTFASQSEELARNLCWLTGMDELWKHVEERIMIGLCDQYTRIG